MSDEDGLLKLVTKLEKKLSEYSQRQKTTQTDKILKVFNHLSTVRMTLGILQTTHIGKTVNGFRKYQGNVGKKAKELVKQWKQLLKTGEPEQRDEKPVHEALCDSAFDFGQSHDDHVTRYVDKSRDDHIIRQADTPVQESLSNLSQQRKRKGGAKIEDSESLSIGLTKRSRTQVYSGKSAGLKYVPSLFDMCMNILINNIDAIYEVGGIPFFILEPVLVKCTPTQLMRLEELNEHFIEDSDGLWQKHTQKEFRNAVPKDGQTWRELYLEKLASREEKMKSITSSIKARQQAREEPVRKAAVLQTLAPLPRRPRGGGNSYFSSQRSLGGPSGSGSSIMKQTMKMAKQRCHMLSSRRGRK